jgi:hypothetical protein
MRSDVNYRNTEILEEFKQKVLDKSQSSYMLTISRDGEDPVRSIYFYSTAIEAAAGYEAYQDWGFSRDFLTVTLYEPTGKVSEKILKRPKGGECTFVREDYNKATKIFNHVKEDIPESSYNYLIFEFAKLFSKDNQRFDYKRFLTDTGHTGDTTNDH